MSLSGREQAISEAAVSMNHDLLPLNTTKHQTTTNAPDAMPLSVLSQAQTNHIKKQKHQL